MPPPDNSREHDRAGRQTHAAALQPRAAPPRSPFSSPGVSPSGACVYPPAPALFSAPKHPSAEQLRIRAVENNSHPIGVDPLLLQQAGCKLTDGEKVIHLAQQVLSALLIKPSQ